MERRDVTDTQKKNKENENCIFLATTGILTRIDEIFVFCVRVNACKIVVFFQ